MILKEKLLNQDTYNYAKQEAAIHEMVSNHNNVVRLYDQKEDEKQFQMIMEYADKGDYFADKINEVSQPFIFRCKCFLKGVLLPPDLVPD